MVMRGVGPQSNEETYKNICQNCQHPRPDSNCMVVNRNQEQLSMPISLGITGQELKDTSGRSSIRFLYTQECAN